MNLGVGASEGEGERRGERGETPSIGGGVVGDKPPIQLLKYAVQ